jgi:hypothetical protein
MTKNRKYKYYDILALGGIFILAGLLFYYIFYKKRKVLTFEDRKITQPYTKHNSNCRNCGAPYTNTGGKCLYCGTL